MVKIAVNGLGRIGKLVLRNLIDQGASGDIVWLDDPVRRIAKDMIGASGHSK